MKDNMGGSLNVRIKRPGENTIYISDPETIKVNNKEYDVSLFDVKNDLGLYAYGIAFRRTADPQFQFELTRIPASSRARRLL